MKKGILALVVAGLLLAPVSQALAAATSSGVVVTNQASLTYSVDSIAITTPVRSDSDPLTAGEQETVFTVDKLVRPFVQLQTTPNPLLVTPGSTTKELLFWVSNNGNDPMGGPSQFELSIANITNEIAPTAVTYEIDTNDDGAYETTGLSLATTSDVPIAAGTRIRVRILADIPLTALDTKLEVYDLVAHAYNSAGTVLLTAADNAASDTSIEQIVLDDESGSASDGAVKNAKHAARGTYKVTTATLTFTKTEEVIDDNLGGTTKFHVPGATVRYTLTITNNGAADATDVTVVDQIPTYTTFVATSLTTTAGTKSYKALVGDVWSTSETSPVGFFQVVIPSIAATTGTETITYDVKIN